MASITELKHTPGFTPSIVELKANIPDELQQKQQEAAEQSLVSPNSNPEVPPASGGFAPQVSSQVPGEQVQVPASDLKPQEADTSALAAIGDALGGLLGGGTEEDASAAGGLPEGIQEGPELTDSQQIQLEALAYAPKGGGILSSMAPDAVGNLQPLPEAPEPVKPTSGYKPVLPGIINPGENTAARPPLRTMSTYIEQSQNAQTVPETINAVVQSYRSNPDSFKIDASSIADVSTEVGKNWNFGSMKADSLVIHHTAGRGTREGVIQTFKERGYPAHFIIERDGTIVQVLGLNQRGQHTKNAEDGSGINNANSWGVEIIAKDDSDLAPVQVEAALKLANYLEGYGLKRNRIVAHGAINRHKQATEGKTVLDTLRAIGG